MSPRRWLSWLAAGAAMAVGGWTLSFLMVWGVLPPSFGTALAGYALLTAGSLVGLAAAWLYRAGRGSGPPG